LAYRRFEPGFAAYNDIWLRRVNYTRYNSHFLDRMLWKFMTKMRILDSFRAAGGEAGEESRLEACEESVLIESSLL